MTREENRRAVGWHDPESATGVSEASPTPVADSGSGPPTLSLGNLFWAPVETVRADAIWKNEAQLRANAALLLCNLNGQVKGAKDSALDTGGFGRSGGTTRSLRRAWGMP